MNSKLTAVPYQDGYVFVEQKESKQPIEWAAVLPKVIAQTPDLTFPVPCVELEEDLNTIAFNGIHGMTLVTGHPLEARQLSIAFKLGYQAKQAKEYSKEDLRDHLINILNGDYIHTVTSSSAIISVVDEYLKNIAPQIETIELQMLYKNDRGNWVNVPDNFTPFGEVIPTIYHRDGREYYIVKTITYNNT